MLTGSEISIDQHSNNEALLGSGDLQRVSDSALHSGALHQNPRQLTFARLLTGLNFRDVLKRYSIPYALLDALKGAANIKCFARVTPCPPQKQTLTTNPCHLQMTIPVAYARLPADLLRTRMNLKPALCASTQPATTHNSQT